MRIDTGDGLAGAQVEDAKLSPEVDPGSSTASTTRARDPIGRGAVICIAVAATLGVLPWLGASMFADEGATLYSAHLSWSNLWAQSQHVDLVLLPYYVLIHFWQMISANIMWVRALSLFAFFGTIMVMGWTGLYIAGRWCGIIAAVLTATSTLLIEKSLNARPYALSTLAVALTALMLLRWLNDPRTRFFWAFSLLALVATAMQLFSVLAPVAMLSSVLLVRPKLLRRRWRALRAPIVVFVVLSGAWLIACMTQVGQVNWIGAESTESRLLAEARGPVIGQLYLFVLFLVTIAVVTKFAITWTRDGRERVVEGIRRDRDVLALTVGWALVPTLALDILSFAHPIYSVRYVCASAPAVALLVAFLCVRVFPEFLDRTRGSARFASSKVSIRMMAAFGAVAGVLLIVGFVGSASALQEDLKSPAQYIAENAERGDVIALPDHALTSAVEYYLAADGHRPPLWPQVGVRQRFVEGFDLLPRPSGHLPRRVWIVADGSVPITRFEKAVLRDGYSLRDYASFDGSMLFRFDLTLPSGVVIAPSNGATLSGTAAFLDATWYTNGVGITEAQFVITGGPHSYSKKVIGMTPFTDVGYALTWDTSGTPNGTYSIQSRVVDAEGRTTYSPPVVVKVNN